MRAELLRSRSQQNYQTGSCSALHTQQTLWSQNKYQRHGCKQHDVGINRIEQRSQAKYLARNQSTKYCLREGTDTAQHHDNKGLNQDTETHVGHDRDDRPVDDTREAGCRRAHTEYHQEGPLDVDPQQSCHERVFDARSYDQAQTRAVQHQPAKEQGCCGNAQDLDAIQGVDDKPHIDNAFAPGRDGYTLSDPTEYCPNDFDNNDTDTEGDKYLVFDRAVIETFDQSTFHDQAHEHGGHCTADNADDE